VVERSGVFDVGARHGVPVPTSATDDAVGAVREPPLPEPEGSGAVVGAALVAVPGQPQGLPLRRDEKTQNRGNEAKNSLKTNEVTKTNRANRTHIGARKAPKEAQKAAFRCTDRSSRRREFRLPAPTVAWAPRTGMVWSSRMRRSVA